MSPVSELQALADDVVASARDALLDAERLVVVKAPPGAGKTHLLLQLLAAGHGAGLRMAVATFTNNQADDVCRRLASEHPKVPVMRWLSGSGTAATDLGSSVMIGRKGSDLPAGSCAVVATTSKWALANSPVFDVLLVDEAWQISWADFALLRSVSGRFVLIGDPGQIPPVVSIETQRWETSPNAPHVPTPELLLQTRPELLHLSELPGSRRLPADAVDIINAFYDFDFGAFAEPGDRYVRVGEGGSKGVRQALSRLSDRSIIAMTLPTPDDGPPVEIDDDIADLVANIVRGLLDGETMVSHGSETRKKPGTLTVSDIGIVSTHRSMNTRVHYRLPKRYQHVIRVDTPERWQGLEKKVMIAVHPLSGITEPSAFELETGRLCVMASRHQAGLILVTRDHVSDTLREHIVSAEQPVGRPDVAGRGHDRHTRFWHRLVDADSVVAM